FIDLQVNGGGDVLFNNSPTPDAIARIVAAHRKFGTTSLLPTLITETFEKMKAAKAACESLVGKEPSVLGLHFEGTYLSPEKAGVHDPNLIRTPSLSDLEMLCADREGALMVTLAPERVPREFIGSLVKSGVHISLGHSMATYEEARAAKAQGLNGFTHLFNAMRPLASREPGPIALALESPDVWFGIIVDGFHVNPVILRVALRGLGRPMLVTDAMPPVGGSRPSFSLYGHEIQALGGRCLRADGTLAGTVLDMASAVRNCVSLLQVPLEDALGFASRNPAEFIGFGDGLGKTGGGVGGRRGRNRSKKGFRLGKVGRGEKGIFRRGRAITPRRRIFNRAITLLWPSLVCSCPTVCAATFEDSRLCPANYSSA